jgi:uncharacterized membrane protein
MKNSLFYLFLLSLSFLVLFFVLYEFNWRITGMFVGFGSPRGEFEWWNVSWRYRVRLEINSSGYSREDWPIEYRVNFTDLLPLGTFDENSTRVVEYSSSGQILYELPSQFDKDDSFDASNNAFGTLVFLMNGTTQANQKRIFYLYYDTVENGVKEKPSYTTSLTYVWDGEEFNVNNTMLAFWVDTARGEKTSGLYRVKGIDSGNDIWSIPASSERTIEYVQYSNGTHNFTFDLQNDATFKYVGPVRIVVEQDGNENVWDSTNTTEGFMVKKYTFYDELGWIKIETNFTNLGSNTITRNSTFAGALAVDAARAFGSNWQSSFGNISQPGWWYASDQFSSFHTGIIHVNQTGTNNFWVPNSSLKDRIGIQLNSTSVPVGGSITETVVIHFNDTSGDYTQVRNLRERLADPVKISEDLPEQWYVVITPTTNATVYNRNESVLLKGNISMNDPYNLTEYMNATIDMGTTDTSDDQTVILYDDGTHGDETIGDRVFTNSFNLPNDASTGTWTINFTAYTNDSKLLNSSLLTFDVTDVLNVTVNITNKKPIVNSLVIAKVYVKNYRQDSWVPGAMINCNYDSTEVMNKTDHNNGTYSVNFTSPNQEGIYTLTCNATKNGNFGNDTDTFTTETGKTNVSVAAEPSNPTVPNVSLYYNDSFSIVTNATNIGNGTAYSTNISLELLSGWNVNETLEECGDLEKNAYCTKSFSITVPNATSPGNYYLNVTSTWRNPDGSVAYNKTQVNVTVESNPRVRVEEAKVSGEAGDGIWTLIGNFTVSSIGNDALQNVTFSCISGDVCNDFILEFLPTNISGLSVGLKQSVSVNVSVPFGYDPGTYNGTVNVSAENDKFDTFTLELVVPSKTNVSIVTTVTSYTVNNVTQRDNETFSFSANSTNVGNGSARLVNVSITIPSGWYSNSSLENCGNLTKGDTCTKSFSITVPNATSPGNYFVNVSVNWINPDDSSGTNETSITVIVSPNPVLNVRETNVSGIIPDGTEKTVGNFTVLSVGNDALQNIDFDCYSGVVCQNFTVEFIPSSIPSLDVNSNQSVMVNITVPIGYAVGTYNGTVNVSAENDGYETLTLEVTVAPNRTWIMIPDFCEKSQDPPEGLVCEVNVTNLGNVHINFTVSPEEGNYTKVNETSFIVETHAFHIFSVNYNVTGIPSQVYNSTFIVDAIQDATPDNKSLRISLLPYIPPLVKISIVPNETEELSEVEFFVNVTDQSGSGIDWVKANVTRPDGLLDSFDLIKIYESDDLSTWHLIYPNITGNTSQRGAYKVIIYAKDMVGNVGKKNTTFLVYKKLNILMSTLSGSYYQGDTGSIFYVVRDVNNTGVSNVNVTFTVKDPNQNVSYSAKFTSDEEGTISPLPSFFIASDAPVGVYTLISNSTFFDDVVNKTVKIVKNTTFQVLSRAISVVGLFADLETAVVWYPDNVMRFGILVYNGEGKPTDPTSMNLTVYDPAENLYFSASMQQMTKETTGFYTYKYAMPASTASGMYLAVLNATQDEFQTMKLKSFRVAHGGPYDLFLQLFEHEVQQGDYLDFAIIIENKGEVSQDVYLEWWVSSGNDTYYYESGWVYTPSLSNQTITKQAYIFSDQALGTYTLNVRMTYDNVQPPISANTTFTVLASELIPPNITYPPVTVSYPSAPTYTPPALAPMPKVTERIAADISIIRYTHNITLARGSKKIESVVVKNTGEVDLNNVSIFILGIPTSWFNITPGTYKTLQPDSSSIFLIEFNIPENVEVGEYVVNITVFSGVIADQKYVTITIFRSLEELMRDEIMKLRRDLQTLEEDMEEVKREGKDVSGVLLFIDEIKTQISLAEENLKKNNTDDALTNVETAKNLMNRAKTLLTQIEFMKVERVFAIPLWILLLVVIVATSFSVLLVFLNRRKGFPTIRPYIVPLGRVAEKAKEKKTKEELIKEREKLLRMLEVLEKEKKEGLISKVAYREMKENIQSKLAKINKKLE